jgi:hypothetical protein
MPPNTKAIPIRPNGAHTNEVIALLIMTEHKQAVVPMVKKDRATFRLLRVIFFPVNVGV